MPAQHVRVCASQEQEAPSRAKQPASCVKEDFSLEAFWEAPELIL